MAIRTLGSRYLLDERIGQGGMGVVWRGRDKVTGTPYAIKLLRSEYASDPDAVTRFVRERTVLMKFRHPAVVTLHDMIVEGDQLALVMDLVDGGDLNAYRQRSGGTLSNEEAARLAAQICDGLAAAHAAGIVHRDLKPANVLLDAGQVKLADFGVARIVGDPSATTTGTVLGTAAYLAPELLTGSEPSEASDVYAFGITLYELLSGRPPFNGHVASIMHDHLQTKPGRLTGMPGPLWDLLSSCLAKEPAVRPAAAAMGTALRKPALLRVLAQATPVTPASPTVPSVRTMAPAAFSPAPVTSSSVPVTSRSVLVPSASAPVAPAVNAPVIPAYLDSPTPAESYQTGPHRNGLHTGSADAATAGLALRSTFAPFGGSERNASQVEAPPGPADPPRGPGEPPRDPGQRDPARRDGRVKQLAAAGAAVVLIAALVGIGALTHVGPFGSTHKAAAGLGRSGGNSAVADPTLSSSQATAGPSPTAAHHANPSHTKKPKAKNPLPPVTASPSRSTKSSGGGGSGGGGGGGTLVPYGADLAVDGTFSDPSLSAWDYGVYHAQISPGAGVNGQNAVGLTATPTAGIAETLTGLKSGGHYVMSGYVEASASPIYIGARDEASGKEVDVPAESASWQKLSINFVVPQGQTTAVIFCVQRRGGTGFCSNIAVYALHAS
jgi:serine/threonine-protein kinase